MKVGKPIYHGEKESFPKKRSVKKIISFLEALRRNIVAYGTI